MCLNERETGVTVNLQIVEVLGVKQVCGLEMGKKVQELDVAQLKMLRFDLDVSRRDS